MPALVSVDGVVVAGNSFVDQAPITGESLPVEKLPGSQLYVGTINQSGVIEVRTEGIGRDTAFGKIIETVERAEQSRALALGQEPACMRRRTFRDILAMPASKAFRQLWAQDMCGWMDGL